MNRFEIGMVRFLVPMAHVKSVPASIAFYRRLVPALREYLIAEGIEAGAIQYPFYAPRGEFRIQDPDGYVIMVTHT